MNVIFIVLDTMRKDKLSIYNDEIDFTENIERFSKDAAVYKDAVANSSWTIPSHASIFTGMYPWEHGATQKKILLETDRELLAEKFQKNGYRTACYTINSFVSPYTGLAEGFSEVDNFLSPLIGSFFWEKVKDLQLYIGEKKSYLGNYIGEVASFINRKISWIFNASGSCYKDPKTEEILKRSGKFVLDCKSDDEDFFLFVNLMDPHEPYYPEEEYKEKHAPSIDPEEISQVSAEFFRNKKKNDPESVSMLYDACVDYMDDQLGKFFRFLEKNKVLEDTVLIITSDHGQEFGEEEIYGHRLSVSEELISVPLIVHHPDREPDSVDKTFGLRNLYKLVPDLAGIESHSIEEKEHVLGFLDYPYDYIFQVPSEERRKFWNKMKFVRGPDKKLVKYSGFESGYEMLDLGSGKKIPVVDEYKTKIDGAEISSSRERVTVDKPEVKKRLSQLGYR